MIEYLEKAKHQIEKIAASQYENIQKASKLFAKAIIEDKIIHAFGTGHSQMIATEMFARACGLANVNAIMDDLVMLGSGARRAASIERISGLADLLWDKYEIKKGDLMVIISNSGRNAMPVEIALRG